MGSRASPPILHKHEKRVCQLHYLLNSDRLGCAGCPLLVCSNRQRDLLEGQDLTLASIAKAHTQLYFNR